MFLQYFLCALKDYSQTMKYAFRGQEYYREGFISEYRERGTIYIVVIGYYIDITPCAIFSM